MSKAYMRYNRKEFNPLLDELERIYDIMPLTLYQWRFNSVIDIYPSSCKFFDLRSHEWGSYQSQDRLMQFLEERLNDEN